MLHALVLMYCWWEYIGDTCSTAHIQVLVIMHANTLVCLSLKNPISSINSFAQGTLGLKKLLFKAVGVIPLQELTLKHELNHSN